MIPTGPMDEATRKLWEFYMQTLDEGVADRRRYYDQLLALDRMQRRDVGFRSLPGMLPQGNARDLLGLLATGNTLSGAFGGPTVGSVLAK